MMNTRICFSLLAVLVVGLLGLNGPAFASDDEDEDEDDEFALTYDDKLAACGGCHGENGAEPLAPEYPKIAGQHQSYLEHALKSYRSGRRANAIMQMQAQALELTDEDIRKLAAHFAAMPGLNALNITEE